MEVLDDNRELKRALYSSMFEELESIEKNAMLIKVSFMGGLGRAIGGFGKKLFGRGIPTNVRPNIGNMPTMQAPPSRNIGNMPTMQAPPSGAPMRSAPTSAPTVPPAARNAGAAATKRPVSIGSAQTMAAPLPGGGGGLNVRRAGPNIQRVPTGSPQKLIRRDYPGFYKGRPIIEKGSLPAPSLPMTQAQRQQAKDSLIGAGLPPERARMLEQAYGGQTARSVRESKNLSQIQDPRLITELKGYGQGPGGQMIPLFMPKLSEHRLNALLSGKATLSSIEKIALMKQLTGAVKSIGRAAGPPSMGASTDRLRSGMDLASNVVGKIPKPQQQQQQQAAATIAATPTR